MTCLLFIDFIQKVRTYKEPSDLNSFIVTVASPCNSSVEESDIHEKVNNSCIYARLYMYMYIYMYI